MAVSRGGSVKVNVKPPRGKIETPPRVTKKTTTRMLEHDKDVETTRMLRNKSVPETPTEKVVKMRQKKL